MSSDIMRALVCSERQATTVASQIIRGRICDVVMIQKRPLRGKPGTGERVLGSEPMVWALLWALGKIMMCRE